MPHQQVTLLQLRTSLKATWESVPFWSDTEADRAINEALRWWNLFTGYWRKIEPLVTVANQVFYSLSSTLILPARVNFSSYPLDVGTIFDMNQGRPAWRGETTATGAPVPVRPAIWIPVGMKRIAIWPADATGGTQLLVDAIRSTPVLTADADFVDIGQEELSAISGEALHLAAFKEGGNRWNATRHFHTSFLRQALARNSMLYASDFFRKAAGIETHRSQVRMRREEMEPRVAEGGQ